MEQPAQKSAPTAPDAAGRACTRPAVLGILLQPAADVRTSLLGCLQQSRLFREYQQAFEASTGLPLVLRAAGSFHAPLQGSKRTNPFCALMIQSNKTCASCLQLQQRVEKKAAREAKTLQCYAGLSESAVPVLVGDHVLGYLQTGQVFLSAPSTRRFLAVSRNFPGGDAGAAYQRLETAYFQTRVVTPKQYQAAIGLLVIFAEHLATVGSQLLARQTAIESPLITKVRAFIALHQNEALGLADAAHAVNMSTFHFCKIFKKATGLTFTEYLAHARIEAVKQKLLDVHMRVSEAAYATGFQSLSQFNRVFLRFTGEAPSRYRERVHERNSKAVRPLSPLRRPVVLSG